MKRMAKAVVLGLMFAAFFLAALFLGTANSLMALPIVDDASFSASLTVKVEFAGVPGPTTVTRASQAPAAGDLIGTSSQSGNASASAAMATSSVGAGISSLTLTAGEAKGQASPTGHAEAVSQGKSHVVSFTNVSQNDLNFNFPVQTNAKIATTVAAANESAFASFGFNLSKVVGNTTSIVPGIGFGDFVKSNDSKNVNRAGQFAFNLGAGQSLSLFVEGFARGTADAAPVPEPMMLFLFGTAAVVLGLVARWRQRRQS